MHHKAKSSASEQPTRINIERGFQFNNLRDADHHTSGQVSRNPDVVSVKTKPSIQSRCADWYYIVAWIAAKILLGEVPRRRERFGDKSSS